MMWRCGLTVRPVMIISNLPEDRRETVMSKSVPKALMWRRETRSQEDGRDGVNVKACRPVGLMPKIPSVTILQ